MSILTPGQNDDAEVAAHMAELNKAPKKVRELSAHAFFFGLTIILRFCAAAFVGHLGWGTAIISGIAQFLLITFISVSVQTRRLWAWCVLLGLTLYYSVVAFGLTIRLVRTLLEFGFAGYGRNILLDLAGVAQLVTTILLWICLFSRDVRTHVFKPPSPYADSPEIRVGPPS